MPPLVSNPSDYQNIHNIAFSRQASLFRRRLQRWFKKHHRQFDWRKTKDPYTILLSEVLLQRTQAPQVACHFNRILQRFPTPAALYKYPHDEVLKVLRPLGLAKRAGTLIAMAEVLSERFNGEIPADPDLLVNLPGVGRYIASATACFAFGRRIPLVDTNVVRILLRYFGVAFTRKRPHQDPQLWKLAELMLPKRNAEDYNRALIDFAALVCTARRPICQGCPMQKECHSIKNSL